MKAVCGRKERTCHISHQYQRIQHHQSAPSGTLAGHYETYPGATWLHGVCACEREGERGGEGQRAYVCVNKVNVH